ncbi:unnamed protein product [Urochloa decumbens]|uniref:Uncharacterized protein n=1 Tax=Urochloa decumbens TaxID=240449 RepID=A0ABC9D1J4_9POAL
MSLRYASRVVLRAAQAVRARQPAAPRPMPLPAAAKPSGTASAPAAQRPQGGQQVVSGAGGGVAAGVSAEKAIVAEKLRRSKAQKAENVMHLVCWGPN